MVLCFRKLLVPSGFLDFLYSYWNSGLSRGAKYLRSSLSMMGRVIMSTILLCSGSDRLPFLFLFAFSSVLSKSKGLTLLFFPLTVDALWMLISDAERTEVVLKPDVERESPDEEKVLRPDAERESPAEEEGVL